jgi:hypothetical protein
MAASPRRNVTSDVRRFLEDAAPCSYCNACLALRFETSLDEAKAIATTLNGSPGFVREDARCDACGRTTDVISVGTIGRRRKRL